jgi:hypothetical protein
MMPITPTRPCHGNVLRAESGRGQSDLCSGDSRLPFCRRFGSESPQRRSGNEVALKIERVVDSGMDAEEALRRPGRLEALHLALSSAHGLMGVFGAVVLFYALLMRAC